MNRNLRNALLAAAGSTILCTQVQACLYHALMGLPEPTGVWPSDPSTATSQIRTMDATEDAAISDAIANGPINFAVSSTTTTTNAVIPTVDTYVTSWVLNTTGVTGRSTNTTINNAVKSISANIQEIAYTSTSVYVKATGIPDYNIGPFNGNPNIPANDNATFDIPRNPTPATTHQNTGLGAIGVLINGVDIFNWSDGNTYNNAPFNSNTSWHNNAGVVEAPSFDSANAHPQQQGVYHNHENPVSLISEIGASSTNPEVIGYAIDGYPILNDYASLTKNGALVKMLSGYALRSYTGSSRPTTPQGTGTGGPSLTSYADGYFAEDYQWQSQTEPAGYAECDQYNGAFVYTPQFPNGTYAYFATTDTTGKPAFPYMLGMQYYGTPASDDTMGGTVTVPTDAVIYSVPEPASLMVMIALGTIISVRRQSHPLLASM